MLLWVALCCPVHSEHSDRPVPAAGPESQTLLVFGAARWPFSLGDELEMVKLRLRRVVTHLQTVSAGQMTSNQLAAADYVVVFSAHPAARFDRSFFDQLETFQKPILWVGHGAAALTRLPGFKNEVLPGTTDGRVAKVEYREREWDLTQAYWIPLNLNSSSSNAEILIGGITTNDTRRLPISFRLGNVTVFSAIPGSGALGYLFDDLMLDFFGAIPPLESSRVFFRIDDFQARTDPAEFKRIVDHLASRGHPFLISVTPAWTDPETGDKLDLDSAPRYVASLRYAQEHGGRLVLRGCSRGTDGSGELWDTRFDRPLSSEAQSGMRADLHRAVNLLLRHRLFPLAWQTPGDAASSVAYNEVAEVLSTAVERPQLSDRTHLEKGVVSALTLDRYGRQIVPENLGFVPGGVTNFLDGIRNRGEFLLQLRGTISGCFIHAYQPLDKLKRLVDLLESWDAGFLDLAELDNWLHVPGRVLLSGDAEYEAKLGSPVVSWKAFNRAGRMLSSGQDSVSSMGSHVFRRKGKGAYELCECREATP
jgi:hypothetical protein